MLFIDKEINLNIEKEFTSVKPLFEALIKEQNLVNANIFCWLPHEVASLVFVGWEDGLIDDLKQFLDDAVPEDKYKHHDEPDTPFRYNSYEHFKTKLVGNTSVTLIVKEGKLYFGQYQDIYLYCPTFKDQPDKKIFCRILNLQGTILNRSLLDT